MAVPEGQNGSCAALLGAWQESGGLGRDAEALEEAVPCPAPSSSRAGVWAETGLCGGKEWYTLGGGSALLRVRQPGRCGAGAAPSKGDKKVLGAEISVGVYPRAATWPFAGRVTSG